MRMLAWLLVTLLVMTMLPVALTRLESAGLPDPRMQQYAPFILQLDVLLVIAYLVNAAGHYHFAAGLTVLCASFGPWGAMYIDPSILHGDFVPLTYVTLSVVLCSILLSPLVTAFLAALQFGGFALVAWLDPASAVLDWPSLLTLLFFASALSILSSTISRDNLAVIDRQTRRLEESEKELRELSVRDHLTGLFNRRYLEEALAREIRRALRSHYTIGVILFDLDQLKPVNDRFGHEAGDALLQAIGELAKQSIRGGDIACRLGGDEFVLVLPEASRDATLARAEQLRDAVKLLDLHYQKQQLDRVTISAGVAMHPIDGVTVASLMKAADQAMYAAKQAGRDSVYAASINAAMRAAGE